MMTKVQQQRITFFCRGLFDFLDEEAAANIFDRQPQLWDESSQQQKQMNFDTWNKT